MKNYERVFCRGKLKETGKWVEGLFMQEGIVNSSIIVYPLDLIIKDTITFSVGKRSKKGIRIFEGDYVLGGCKEDRGLIIWDNKMCGYYIKPMTSYGKAMYSKYFKLSNKTLEIVGNKWDNPELYVKGWWEENGQ